MNLYTISQQQFEDFVNINLTESNTLSSSNVKVIQTSEYTLYNNILDFPTKLPCFVKKKEDFFIKLESTPIYSLSLLLKKVKKYKQYTI